MTTSLFAIILSLNSVAPAPTQTEQNAQVHILVEGYVKPIEGREFVPGQSPTGARKVAGTVVLVRSPEATVVVDPGMVEDRRVILTALARHHVNSTDVTHVFVSHHHPDHTVNIALFPNAKVVDYQGVYENDVWSDHGDPYPLAPGITVIRTPGHTYEDASLVVETAEGTVVLTHLWWDERMEPRVDPIAEAPELINVSREKVLAIADWIIPGHGKKFPVKTKSP